MAKLDLALIVRTVDKATAPLRRIQQSVRQVGRSTGLDRVGRQMRAVGRQLGNVGREAGRSAGASGWSWRGGSGRGGAFGSVRQQVRREDDIAEDSLEASSAFGVEELQKLRYAFELRRRGERSADVRHGASRFGGRSARLRKGPARRADRSAFLGIDSSATPREISAPATCSLKRRRRWRKSERPGEAQRAREQAVRQ